VEAVAWTAIVLLAAALVGDFVYLGRRIDAQTADLGRRIDEQTADLGRRIDAVSARIDMHLERHAG
jgi:hypothetical protein